MKRVLVLAALLAACSAVAPPDAGGDVAQQVPEAGVEAGTDVAADALGDASQCSPACPAPFVCGERLPGQFGCEFVPDGGTCPGGWHYCGGRCWLVNGAVNCGRCGNTCAGATSCVAADGGWDCR